MVGMALAFGICFGQKRGILNGRGVFMTEKAENTRQNILNTALKHFLEYGFAGTSLRSIVKDAGLTTGAFYKYYPTKEALFDALIDPYVEELYGIYDSVLEEFQSLPPEKQTENMASASGNGMDQMVNYVYDHYDNFKLLLRCSDNEKYGDMIHNLVGREMRSSKQYVDEMHRAGINVPDISVSLCHMIYSGFFSAIFQIIEHDMDRETAIENVGKLKKFYTGGWERLWKVQFPE